MEYVRRNSMWQHIFGNLRKCFGCMFCAVTTGECLKMLLLGSSAERRLRDFFGYGQLEYGWCYLILPEEDSD